MSRPGETIDQSWSYRIRQDGGDPIPGLLLLFSGSEPWLRPIRLGAGGLVLGRDDVGGIELEDGRMSRRHAEVRFVGGRFSVKDLASRNGTFLDGQQLIPDKEVTVTEARVLRVGDTLFGLVADLRPFEAAVVEQREGVVVGPTLRERWDQIERLARAGDTLHITGETGSGKELAARHFHESSARKGGPFIAVNCATIAPNLAERLLFGAKKGAYSGADADAEGYVQAAHGGTLFLDEIGELELGVQGKLLRVLETREVVALGAAKPKRVEIGLCSATHADLRARSGSGAFRSDLFYRIGRPAVALPSLRERLEDVPFIIQQVLERQGKLRAHVSLVEACLMRPWPGNVRELVVELRAAAIAARESGSSRVELHHLDEQAGQALGGSEEGVGGEGAGGEGDEGEPAEASDDQIKEALRKESGNVTRAARALGWHRNQLRRWLAKQGVDPKAV